MTESTLTYQEVEAAYLARYDLGPAYPQLIAPPYLSDVYTDRNISDLALRIAPDWTPGKQRRLNDDLVRQLVDMLGLPLDARVSPTFSGSVALDRALATASRLAVARGFRRLHVVTTTPSIDILRLFLLERSGIETSFVESKDGAALGALDCEAVLERVREGASTFADAMPVALLCSPENPSGRTWSSRELSMILEETTQHGGIAILDHCFALAGVQPDRSACIWDTPTRSGWIGIWDTGKTFGLNGDKLGFLITTDSEIQEHAQAAISLLQFDVPRRQKIFFKTYLELGVFNDEVDRLRSACISNLKVLRDRVKQTPITVRSVHSGSVALIDIHELGFDDEIARTLLLKQGVGVISGQVFFHTSWKPTRFLRVALARERPYFERCADRMVSTLIHHTQGLK